MGNRENVDAYRKAFAVIRDKYRDEYEMLVRMLKKEIVFLGNRDSIRDVGKYRNSIYYNARKELISRYRSEYDVEVRKYLPYYNPNPIATWVIREYEERIELYCNKQFILESDKMSEVLARIKKGT